jgi:hypothetical protein
MNREVCTLVNIIADLENNIVHSEGHEVMDGHRKWQGEIGSILFKLCGCLELYQWKILGTLDQWSELLDKIDEKVLEHGLSKKDWQEYLDMIEHQVFMINIDKKYKPNEAA